MTTLFKYPRSVHLPESPGATSDDKIISASELEYLSSLEDFVVTEKMDGGNLTFYKDYFHGRSLDSGTQAWDTAAKALWAGLRHSIPEGWRISGESLYARRSVSYERLPGVYLMFGAWDDENNALAWDLVKELAYELKLPLVPELYRGPSFKRATEVWHETHSPETSEGFVVRNAQAFPASDFSKNLAKYVRADHVRTRADWRHRDDFEVNTFV